MSTQSVTPRCRYVVLFSCYSFLFQQKLQEVFLDPKFPLFTAWKDTPGAAAFFSLTLPVAGEAPSGADTWRVWRHQQIVRGKKKLEATFPTPCSNISNQAKELLFKNKNLFCIPESVRAAPSSCPSLAAAVPGPEPPAQLGARAQEPFPGPLMSRWHSGQECQRHWGHPPQSAISEQLPAGPVCPLLHECNGAEKLKCWGAGEAGEKERKKRETLKAVSWKHMF